MNIIYACGKVEAQKCIKTFFSGVYAMAFAHVMIKARHGVTNI